jgi:putative two-component system response regulator
VLAINQSREGRTPTILVVDDEPLNTRLLSDQLEAEGYAVRVAMNGPEALEMARSYRPDLILLDVMMPGMSGLQVAQELKQSGPTQSIPVVMVTALGDRESKLETLRSGACEFLLKPVDRVELLVRVRSLLKMKRYQDELAEYAHFLEAKVAERTEALRESYRETILALTRAAEYKDEETGEHVRRISHYSAELARSLGMSAQFCDEIFHASPMHDVGKIGIPDSILRKPGSLTPAEWTRMKAHTTIGAQLLVNSPSPYVCMGADIALCHHERWDGSGYPRGLAGEEIPLAARVMAVGDVYDALRSRRPYKEPFSHERAVEVITKGDGRTSPAHFDPAVLALFERHSERFNDIFEAWRDQVVAAE